MNREKTRNEAPRGLAGRLPRLAAGSLCILLLLLAGRAGQVAASHRYRAQYDRLPAEAGTRPTLPASIRFVTVALGGFRGIVADALWIRASILQEKGRYFELVQLADWITALEPHFPEVWIFHAWNLAYNVSVLFESPEDRWRWVRHGIALLRDRGIVFNPDSPSLCRELGWIFLHKIGSDYDSAHWYYKRSWAREMEPFFPEGRLDYDRLVSAPSDRRRLLADPQVASLVDHIRAAGEDPFDAAVLHPRSRPPSVDRLLQNNPAAAVLLDFIRRNVLEHRYKLQPDIMRQVEEICGPLDWRLPYAHSAYWGYRGAAQAQGFEKLACERMVYQSAAAAFRQGKLYYDRERDIFILLPKLDMFEHVLRTYQYAAAQLEDPAPALEARYYFLRMATLYFYVYSGPEEARRVFAMLRSSGYAEEVPTDLDRFLVEETLRTSPPGDLKSILNAVLYQAAFWEALDFPDRAQGFTRLARLLWKEERQRAATTAAPSESLFEKRLEEARQQVKKTLSAAVPVGPENGL